MTDAIRPSRTETFEHTISGLLKKRAELYGEAERIRDRLAEIKNDIDAVDRVLGTLGYTGDLDAEMPRQRRHVVFGKGELHRAVLGELRGAVGPISSREIGQAILAVEGKDGRDRKLLGDHVKRVGKVLRILAQEDVVRKMVDAKGNVVWSLRSLGR